MPRKFNARKELASYELRALAAHLKAGHICLIPSDTAWSAAVAPFPRPFAATAGVTRDLDRALGRGGEKISLAFADVPMAARFVQLDAGTEAVVADDKLSKLTSVLPAASPALAKWARRELFADNGKIGVRLPASEVERALSAELGRPITTIALYRDGGPVKEWGDAVRVLEEALGEAECWRETAEVIDRSIVRGPVSTVVDFPAGSHPARNFDVLREGAIPASTVRRFVGPRR